MILEICVDDAAGLDAAVAGGADRIELCAALGLGGLSPSEALLQAARGCPVPVYAMVRPRAGDFLWSDAELGVMAAEIARVRALGLAGVVLGAAADAPGTALDMPALARLSQAAEGLGRTLHRVIDLLPSRTPVLADVAALGFERVLTSGGATAALAGLEDLAAQVAAAPPGLAVMPGGGIRPDNVAAVLRRSGAREVHASASAARSDVPAVLTAFGFAPAEPRRTDAATVRALRQAIDALA
ncbi:copper homeostasis protein CutC [Aurantimonas sp. MSK8Z-1]|uniref:copper homeostasis protein CutC n=1 Tax=Mangrovibrevibacter kandeliae TaxID=2968473 RepID=UPI00211947FF|nr:copper homeostasis protein CutC [Aurantimonas sp. MSK8Z-1]MCW4116448.1 copper homeostasis protein CutC [Aurantimonas sp. MSK8Z-1]